MTESYFYYQDCIGNSVDVSNINDGFICVCWHKGVVINDTSLVVFNSNPEKKGGKQPRGEKKQEKQQHQQ